MGLFPSEDKGVGLLGFAFPHAITAPLHWAMSVPRATPSICILKPNTNTSEATILMMFCVIDTTIGVRVSCMPMNQPVIT